MYEMAKNALDNCIGKVNQHRAAGSPEETVKAAKDLANWWMLKAMEIELNAITFAEEIDSGF